MGRWSRLVADGFVASLSCADGLRWLDVGCGTGALTAAVAARCRPRMVVGLDRSAGFVVSARAAAPASGASWWPTHCRCPCGTKGATWPSADWRSTSFPSRAQQWPRWLGWCGRAGWSRRTSGTTPRAWRSCGTSGMPRSRWSRRLPRWTRAGGSWCAAGPLRALWTEAGLVDVAVAPIEVPTVFAGFADLWEPFLAGQGPAPGYVAALAPTTRDRLRDTLGEAVPTRHDGSIAFTARAWAVQGTGRRNNRLAGARRAPGTIGRCLS